MKHFEYEVAESLKEASELKVATPNSEFMAGGTDLIGKIKKELLPERTSLVIDIKGIEEAKGGIEVKGDTMTIGALTKLVDIFESEDVKAKVPALSTAAHSVATPIIRNAGTIGGNICQDVRCWFYRYPNEAAGRLVCARKCGDECYAIHGENRYHSIFGGFKICASQCTSECPAGTDISEYMEQVRNGNWDNAAEIIMRANPMPMITSRICPHPCQDVCNQGKHGDCVNIHAVERAVGDYVLANADKFYVAPAEETGKKVAVIGAGPAGLTVAYYLRKAGHAVTVIDKMEKAGGVLMYGIPHYRLPKSIVEDYTKALEGMGVEFKLNTTVGVDITMDEIDAAYDSLFIGTGAWKQPILGISGEEMTQFGLNFLVEVNTYLKKAVSFGEDILVCGGGSVAMDVALTAVRLGAKKVTLACLEQEYEMPATSEEIARAKEEGVVIINGRGLNKVIEKDGKVTGLETKKCVSVYDENHRFSPVYDESDLQVLEADTIILATGQRVDLEFLGENLGDVKSARGLLDVDLETFETKRPHVYGAGDAATGPNIAIRAIAGGAAAARSIVRELGGSIPKEKDARTVLAFDPEGVENRVSAKDKELPVAERSLSAEDSASFTADEAIAEASRCMDCGCYAVSPSDIVPVLLAQGAKVITSERELTMEEFACVNPKLSDVLHEGEIVTKIEVPILEGYHTDYTKFRLRDAVDFAIVSVADAIKVEGGKIADARMVFGGVSPMPRVATEVCDYLVGKEITEEVAAEAAEIAVKDAIPLRFNNYKIQILRSMVKDAVLAAK